MSSFPLLFAHPPSASRPGCGGLFSHLNYNSMLFHFATLCGRPSSTGYNLSVRKYAPNLGPSCLCRSAYSTVAFKKPSLSPAS